MRAATPPPSSSHSPETKSTSNESLDSSNQHDPSSPMVAKPEEHGTEKPAVSGGKDTKSSEGEAEQPSASVPVTLTPMKELRIDMFKKPTSIEGGNRALSAFSSKGKVHPASGDGRSTSQQGAHLSKRQSAGKVVVGM